MRRALDFYPTPSWATRVLLDRAPIRGRVLECCSGQGDISNVLRAQDGIDVFENDLDERTPAGWHFDATDPNAWERMWTHMGGIDWAVSNPPFSLAPQIVELAERFALVGIAMLLRLSYLEPCDNRANWLIEQSARGRILITPRISFTGDGATDSVTTMWLIVSDVVPHGWEVVRKQERSAAVESAPLFTQEAGA